jgi:hypothetical protein
MDIITLDEIPAMSYFMVRLDRNRLQNGEFVLRRNAILTHGNASHTGLKRATADGFSNEVLFRVSPLENPGIYDLAGIGLRAGGNPAADDRDILKPGSAGDNRDNGDSGDADSELFSLYSVSGDGKKLSANIVPEGTDTVPLCFSPGSSSGRFNITVSRMESLRTEGLWLEDLKDGSVTDLLQSGGSYDFEVSPDDDPKRFTVRFSAQNVTGLESLKSLTSLKSPKIYYADGRVVIKGLTSEDAGARLLIYDIQGQLLQQETVTQTPEMSIAAPQTEGVYIFRLEGQRVFTLKFRR